MINSHSSLMKKVFDVVRNNDHHSSDFVDVCKYLLTVDFFSEKVVFMEIRHNIKITVLKALYDNKGSYLSVNDVKNKCCQSFDRKLNPVFDKRLDLEISYLIYQELIFLSAGCLQMSSLGICIYELVRDIRESMREKCF